MIINLYSIYDTVSEVFNKPFTEHNDNSAIRAFTESLLQSRPKTRKDYELFYIGKYNDQTGLIKAEKKRVYTGFEITSEEIEE